MKEAELVWNAVKVVYPKCWVKALGYLILVPFAQRVPEYLLEDS